MSSSRVTEPFWPIWILKMAQQTNAQDVIVSQLMITLNF
jgi:hypothetical protein